MSSESRGLGAMGWLLLLLGVGSIANAGWMLVDPLRWYHELPAGVPDYGDFNPHFVRDIGCAFAAFGGALVWAAMSLRARLPLVSVSAFFFVAHAVLHVYDTARGAVGSHHWWLDLPGVYLPALLLVAATITLARARANAAPGPW